MPKKKLQYPEILATLIRKHYKKKGSKYIRKTYIEITDDDGLSEYMVRYHARRIGISVSKKEVGARLRKRAIKAKEKKLDLENEKFEKGQIFRKVTKPKNLPKFTDLERLALCESRHHGDAEWEGH